MPFRFPRLDAIKRRNTVCLWNLYNTEKNMLDHINLSAIYFLVNFLLKYFLDNKKCVYTL